MTEDVPYQFKLPCTLIKWLSILAIIQANWLTHSNEVNYFDTLSELNLEELLDIKISSASGILEAYRDAPAAILIISQEEISKRGYTSFEEIITDLSGFYVSITNGANYMISYQRGYRTPFTQKTLIMINGIIDNHLWTNIGSIDNQIPLIGIDRIEVLYGPSGAIYSRNAFLGIINIITKSAEQISPNTSSLQMNLMKGSLEQKSIEINAMGRFDDFRYNLASKIYRSDNRKIEDHAPWGYIDNHLLLNTNIWGPIIADAELTDCKQPPCPHKSQINDYGNYKDNDKSYSLIGDLHYKNFTLGTIYWKIHGDFGFHYSYDRVQPNSLWDTVSKQYYLRYQHQFNQQHQVKQLFTYRKSQVFGQWAAADPTTPAINGPDAHSIVSLSYWNSYASSKLYKQNHEYQFNQNLSLIAGIKYERKTTTKYSDVCGFWFGTYCSATYGMSDGSGLVDSNSPTIAIPPKPLSVMPKDNIAIIIDRGIYLQGIWDISNWRINAGVRYDHNSLFGPSINPRASAIYHLSTNTSLKWLFGTAFQEPSPMQLWGVFKDIDMTGDIKPEKARNMEFIFMNQNNSWLHDVSIFYSQYDNVKLEGSFDVGKRHIYGLEYRGQYLFDNIFSHPEQISAYFNYTHTKVFSSVTYNFEINQWIGQDIHNCQLIDIPSDPELNTCQDFNSNAGDIAPHKLNAGFNLPINDQLQLNIKFNYVSSKTLYLTNSFREDNRKLGSYTVVNLSLQYQSHPYLFRFKINNLFDRHYYHSGPEMANSGDDFSRRSQGWNNSIVPQLTRHFGVSLQLNY